MDPFPGRKHRRFRPEVIVRLETLARGSPSEILLQALDRRGPLRARELLADSGLGEVAPEALELLLDEGRAIMFGSARGGHDRVPGNRLLATASWWSDFGERLSQELADYHDRFPLRLGMPREAVRSGFRLEPKLFAAAMSRAASESLILEEGAVVRLPSHSVQFAPDERRRVDALLAQFSRQPYATPSVKESVAIVGEEVLGVLVQRGDLVQVSADVLYLPRTYNEIVARIRQHIERTDSITLAQARDMLGTSRKYAQALLEHLDDKGVTKRVDDRRVLQGT